MVRKKVPTELDKAEIKHSALIERRNVFNAEAAARREERDQLHEQRRVLAAELRKMKDEQAGFVQELRKHKAARNQLQAKAKNLIELRRKVRGKVKGRVGSDLTSLRREVAKIEMDQQTKVMKLSEENELLDELKAKVREMRELEKVKGEEEQVFKEAKEIDAAIDDLFARADEEHAHVVAYSVKANGMHDKITEHVQNMGVIIAEANKRHEEYLEARAKADDQHQKAMEMREMVVSIRGAAQAEVREARQILKQQRQMVRRELYDEKKLDEFANKAVEALLKKGKVEIRG